MIYLGIQIIDLVKNILSWFEYMGYRYRFDSFKTHFSSFVLFWIDEWWMKSCIWNVYSFVSSWYNDLIVFLLKLFVLIHFCHWKEKREHHSSFILNESIHLHCDVCYREWKIIDARKRTHIAIQFECLLSLVLSTVFQQMTINERSPFKTIISSSWCRILFERIDSWNPFSYFIRNKE